MAPHLLVKQLRFARRELTRCLQGVSEDDARKRLLPMNCISWVVGHLAHQENRFWVMLGQGQNLYPELRELVGYGQPASTPPLNEMWTIWHTITTTADPYLDKLTPELLQNHLKWEDGKPLEESIGTMLLRNIYHYWFHIGEAHAMRQMLGHKDLPQFVGDMAIANYSPE